MFEKIFTSLKQCLPEPLRKTLGIEEDEPHVEERSEKYSRESHDTSSSQTENSDDDQKKKRMSMLIRVIVVIGLAFLVIDHFFLQEDPQNEIVNIPKPRKRRIVTSLPKEIKAEDAPSTEVKPDDASEMAKVAPEVKTVDAAEIAPETKAEAKAETKAETKAEAKPPEETPPVENINIAEKKQEEVSPPTIETPSVPEVEVKATEVKSSEQVDKGIDGLIDNLDKTADESSPKKEIKLEDKIQEDEVYTPAPAYDQLGRGLVYNCKEKYWACIDKLSYVSCNKNMKWNKARGKPAECAVLNVYNSDEDCGVVQKYNVSISQPTPFCQ